MAIRYLKFLSAMLWLGAANAADPVPGVDELGLLSSAPANELSAQNQETLCHWYAQTLPAACGPHELSAYDECMTRLPAFTDIQVGQFRACVSSFTPDSCEMQQHPECAPVIANMTITAISAAAPVIPPIITEAPRPRKDRPATEAAAHERRDAQDKAYAGCGFKPGDYPTETIGLVDGAGNEVRLGEQIPIEYIFVVMQENRSFDHYLGRFGDYLKEILKRDPATDIRLKAFIDPSKPDGIDLPGTPYDLLSDADRKKADADLTPNANKGGATAVWNPTDVNRPVTSAADKHYWRRAADLCLSDPTHDWWGVHLQWNAGKMDGFWSSNQDYWAGDAPNVGKIGSPRLTGDRVLSWYDEEHLPVYYWLADRFAIGDRYFSSVLGPTFVNRDYLYAGTSRGLTCNVDAKLDNQYAGDRKPSPTGPYPSLFKELLQKEVPYGFFPRYKARLLPPPVPRYGAFVGWQEIVAETSHGRLWPYDSYVFGAGLAAYMQQENALLLAKIRAGENPERLKPQGRIFSVIFIDADVLEDVNGEDEHPPSDPLMGQRLVYGFLKNLMNSQEVWKRSVVFINYDEHGGFYDHVAPPPACEPDDWLPHGRLTDRTKNEVNAEEHGWSGPYAGAKLAGGRRDHSDESYRGAFNRLGVRAPFIVVSPWVKHGYVSHQTYDHTSVLRFIQAKYDLPALTRRDANADPLMDFFDFSNASDKLRGRVAGWGQEMMPGVLPSRSRDPNDPRIWTRVDLPAAQVEWYGAKEGEKYRLYTSKRCNDVFPPAEWGVTAIAKDPYKHNDFSAGIAAPDVYKNAFPSESGIGEANVRR